MIYEHKAENIRNFEDFGGILRYIGHTSIADDVRKEMCKIRIEDEVIRRTNEAWSELGSKIFGHEGR